MTRDNERLSSQADNDIQGALDLLSNPMANTALQQAVIARSVCPEAASQAQQPPATAQQEGSSAEVVRAHMLIGVALL